jgi:hypothetical protein
MMGWCESELHPDEPDQQVECDIYMCRAGQYAPGVPAMAEDRFVWLCEEHRP